MLVGGMVLKIRPAVRGREAKSPEWRRHWRLAEDRRLSQGQQTAQPKEEIFAQWVFLLQLFY